MKRVSSWRDNFVGHRVYSATPGSNVGHNWLIVDTSSSGTPTYAPVDGGKGLKVDLASTTEAENVCAAFGNVLAFLIDKILDVRMRIKLNQATLDSNSMLSFGVTGDRHDTIDSIAQLALFRLIGSTAIVCETDDGTTDVDDVATGKTLGATALEFVISFAKGKSDVRFFIDGQPVAQSQVFNMSAYSGALQPFVQLQKASDDNVDGYTLEDFEVRFRDE